MTPIIRIATVQDAADIVTIYAPIVRHTAISFELEPPTVHVMQQRIADTLRRLPWLVYERQGKILGYAYASTHRARAAYQWSVDVSVYIHADSRRSGAGRALYTSLFGLLARQGFYNAYAGITLPNTASVSLHETLGFEAIGVYHNVGYKLGAWHDVGWWQLRLQTDEQTPAAPLPFTAIKQDRAAWQAALAAGQTLLRG
jgi:phosphinothricin acetyltransferase